MKIAWTRLALADIRHTRDYTAQENSDAADLVLERIEKAVHNLKAFPHLGRSGRVKNTRELIILGTPYLVAYRVRKSNLEILAAIHGARRWPESL